jgi:hypothetical protein
MALKTKIAGGAAALALAAGLIAAVPTEAAAQWRHRHGGWGGGPGVAAGVVGGLALGAMAAGAANNYYGPGYYAPAYGPECYLTRERVWNGYTWVNRRVRVCN